MVVSSSSSLASSLLIADFTLKFVVSYLIKLHHSFFPLLHCLHPCIPPPRFTFYPPHYHHPSDAGTLSPFITSLRHHHSSLHTLITSGFSQGAGRCPVTILAWRLPWWLPGASRLTRRHSKEELIHCLSSAEYPQGCTFKTS